QRYATTLPSSIFTSSFDTSAIRRSRNDLLAVATALDAASSHDCVLVPITSITRYTPSAARGFLAMIVSSRIGRPKRGGSHSDRSIIRADVSTGEIRRRRLP